MSRRRPTALLILTAAVALGCAAQASATTYYVSPSGNDSASGSSASSPWQTVSKVNNATLQPGDSVLLEGGATFATPLMPAQSGTPSSPISFGSYGAGQANLAGGIWFSQKSNLTFDGIKVDGGAAPGDLSAIQASASGSGSSGITIRSCTLTHVRIGVNSANAGDANWTISNNVIQFTRDSGAIVLGHDLTFIGNKILDTGQDSAIPYGKHGVYAKGSSLTFLGNVIRRFSANGISLRYRNAVVEGNTISDGPIGIAWFQQDASAGTTTIAYNKLTSTSSAGIYISPSDEAGATREGFVIASNTIVGGGGNGVDLNATTGSLTLANNAIGGTVTPAAHLVSPGGSFAEHHNNFSSASGNAQINFNGTVATLATYRSASGQGAGDISAAPILGSDLTPGAGSPLVDAGTTSAGGLPYAAGCDGALFHYCGVAPEIGAIETSALPVPAVAPLAAPSGLTGSSTSTSVTLTWTAAADPRVVSYSVSRDGSAAGSVTGLTTTLNTLTCGTSSTYQVRSVGSDGSTSAAATVQVSTSACAAPPPPPPPVLVVDKTLPWVMISSPATGQTVALKTAVLVRATDASGIANVTFWVDGTQVCVDSTAPYSCPVTLRAGRHTLLVRATDAAGNVAWMSVKVTASSKVASASAATPAAATPAVLPAQGSAVQSHFTLALRAPGTGVRSVSFVLDGRRICRDQVRPFACPASAKRGWHNTVTLLSGAHAIRTLTALFRVR